MIRRSAIGLWMWLGLLSGVGCASGSIPTLDPIAPATVAVNETLRLSLSVQNPENLTLSFSFRTEPGDELGTAATISGTSSGAQFRWSPIASQVGEHQITFTVTSSAGTSEQSTVVNVVSARDQAPVFLLPGAGGSFDLSLTPCVDFDIEVRDDDSTSVSVRARSALPDAAAQLNSTGPKSAEFHWCPTPDEVSAQERWTIRLEADDGDHAPTPHDYVAVLRGIPKPSCPGEAPTISITSPTNDERVSTSGPVDVRITAADDMELRDAPLLYYTRTAPSDLAHPNLGDFEDQIEAEMSGAGWVAHIPSMDLAVGEELTLYIAATITDNDDTAGTDCDHRTDTAAISFTAVGAIISADAAACEACSSSAECLSGFCAATADGGTCLDACPETGSCEHGSCAFNTTIEGSLAFACGDVEAACMTGTACTDDSREDDDATSEATSFTASISDGVICTGDDDYFRIAASARSRVTVTLDGFVHDVGDLDLQILSPAGDVLASSESTDDMESADACVGSDGYLYARVLGYAGDENTYHLSTSSVPNVCCDDDAFEDDDSRVTARALSGTTFSGSICPTDDDYISFTAATARTVTATINFDGTVGDLDLDLYDSTGALVDYSHSVDDSESIVHSVPAGTYAIRVFGYRDAANEYTGSVVLSAP